MRQLTEEERELIWIALGLRENVIETGSYSYDAATLQKMGVNNWPPGTKIKALSTDQMKLLIKSRELKEKTLNRKLFINE